MRSGLASCTALVLSILLCDAAAAQPRSRRQPGAVILGIEELQTSTRSEGYAMLKFIDDPLKPFNEFSLGITKPVVDWVLVPSAKAYRFVVGEPVRKSISRVGYNITYPNRFVSLLLQGELVKSAEESGRFVINTTVGVAGLFDPAARFGFETYDEDVGQAFGIWGIGPGFYLFIPLVGPSSARDAVGLVFDTALNQLTWSPIPGLYALFGLNDFTFWVDDYEALVEVQPNLYVPLRALWSIHRQVQVENFRIPPEAYEDSDPEPLGSLRRHQIPLTSILSQPGEDARFPLSQPGEKVLGHRIYGGNEAPRCLATPGRRTQERRTRALARIPS